MKVSRLRVIKYSFQLIHSVAEEIKADHMGISETDEKVVKKGVLVAFRSAFVKKIHCDLSIAEDWIVRL